MSAREPSCTWRSYSGKALSPHGFIRNAHERPPVRECGIWDWAIDSNKTGQSHSIGFEQRAVKGADWGQFPVRPLIDRARTGSGWWHKATWCLTAQGQALVGGTEQHGFCLVAAPQTFI